VRRPLNYQMWHAITVRRPLKDSRACLIDG
jgi:hypothetical protein